MDLINNDYFNSIHEETLGDVSDLKKFDNMSNSIAHNFLKETKKQDMIINSKEEVETNRIKIIKKLITNAEMTKEELEEIYNIIDEHIWNLKTRLETEINKSGKESIKLNEDIRKMSFSKQKINEMIAEIEENIKTINNDPDIIDNFEELKRMEDERKNFLNIAENHLPYERQKDK